MKVCLKDAVAATDIVYPCGRCEMLFKNYKVLVQHLFWRHGTESYWCNKCCMKRWKYAAHICYVLPFDDEEFDDDEAETTPVASPTPEEQSWRESEFCSCGKYIPDAAMIGCDAKECPYQWYHYSCVGIVVPPDGEWLCPICAKLEAMQVILANTLMI